VQNLVEENRELVKDLVESFVVVTLLVTGVISTSSVAAGAIRLMGHRKMSAKLLEVQKKKIQAKFGSSQ